MRDKQYQTIGDFIKDASFRDWILHCDPAAEMYWHNWVQMNPGKKDVLENAKELLYILKTSGKSISDEEIEIEVEKILSAIKEEPSLTDHIIPPKPKGIVVFLKRNRWKVTAASIIVIAGGLWQLYSHEATPVKESNYETFIVAVKKTSNEYANKADTIQQLQLSDGTTVSLSPKSKFVFSGINTSKREIYLDGEAFFDVAKNSSKPFIVYTNQLVTKVLGTSFWVKAYADERNTQVTVKTGKVSVFKKEVFSEKQNAKLYESGGLVVTPNQQVVIDEGEMLRKKIAEKPNVISAKTDYCFAFDATPVKEVFATMEKAYGINIVFDEEVVASCSLSANMGNESFYEKLNLICISINATYEIIDGNVVISSEGCH